MWENRFIVKSSRTLKTIPSFYAKKEKFIDIAIITLSVMFLSSVSSKTACSFLLISSERSSVISAEFGFFMPLVIAAMIPPYFARSDCKMKICRVAWIKGENCWLIRNCWLVSWHILWKLEFKEMRETKPRNLKFWNRNFERRNQLN